MKTTGFMLRATAIECSITQVVSEKCCIAYMRVHCRLMPYFKQIMLKRCCAAAVQVMPLAPL